MDPEKPINDTDPHEEELDNKLAKEWDENTKRPEDPEKAKYIANKKDEFYKTLDIIRNAEERRFIDPLTKLLTKEAFDRALSRVYELVSRDVELDVYLLALDLDHFKKVNDQYGHPEGDKVLIAASESMQKIRDTDVAARVGGEETCILLVNTGSPDTFSEQLDPVQFANKLRGEITENVASQSEVENQTVSIGISRLRKNPDTFEWISPEQLKQEADIALYNSKHNGRNKVTVFQEGMTMNPKITTAPR